MQLKEGSTLQGGKYRIIRVLGQGGFGITYLAGNIYFDKLVAVKEFFPKDFCGRDNTSHLTLGTQNNADTVAKLKARFLKEARNIARLDHPGVIKIHDIFEENSTAYYVMDYIDGENLNEMVKRNGSLPEAKAVDYITKVGNALEYIHSRNMTHFDVKPANIVVRRSNDEPILIDFGLSKQYDNRGDATSTLMQGVSQGYSPIELYNPGSIATFSPQTDVYSLSATLYYLVTGTVPPSAAQVLEDGLSFPSTVTPQLRSAIESGMQMSRSKRPKTIAGFLTFLVSNVSANNRNLNNTYRDEFHEYTAYEDTQIVDVLKTNGSSPNGSNSNNGNNGSNKAEDGIVNNNSTSFLQSSSNSTNYNENNYVEDEESSKLSSNTWIIIFAIVIISGFVFAVVHNSQSSYKADTANMYVVESDTVTTVSAIEAAVEEPFLETIQLFDSSNRLIGTYYGQLDFNGLPNNEGSIVYCDNDKDGRKSFSGSFKNGYRTQGILYYKNGTVYKGTFKNDQLWDGVITYKDGTTDIVRHGNF